MTGRRASLLSRVAKLSIATRLVLLFGAVALGMTAMSVYLNQRTAQKVEQLERLNDELELKRRLIELETAIRALAVLLDARQNLVLNQDFSGLRALKQQIADAEMRIDAGLDALPPGDDIQTLRAAVEALGLIHDRYLEYTIEASFVPAARLQNAFVHQQRQVISWLRAFGPGGTLDLTAAVAELGDISKEVRVTIGLVVPITIALACLAFLVLLKSVWRPLRRLTRTIERLDAPNETLTISQDGPPEFEAIGRALTALRDRLQAQRAAEADAVRSAAKLQQFTEATTDILWEMGPDLRYARFQGPPERVAAISARQVGRTRWEAAGADPNTEPRWGRHRDDMLARRPYRNFEYFQGAKDASGGWWRSSGIPVFDEAGRFEGYRGAAIDITEQKRYEEQLRRSQSMEMLGRLTSGVAHDFNNLLAVLSSNLEMIGRHAGLPPGPFQDMLARCERATLRGRRLTRRLLSLGHRADVHPEHVDVPAFLDEFSDLVRRTIPDGIALEVELEDDLPQIFVDPGLLQDALLNLVINARDAMPAGGALRITATCSRESLAPGDGAVLPICPAGVVLSVADTGCGIEPELRQRLFEPFFTTKGEGKGTGLGLSMVQDFATRSGGTVDLESTLGQGTTVSLTLPRATVAPAGEVPGTEQGGTPAVATIAMIETEPDLRETLKSMLETLGHRVLCFGSAETAREALHGPGVAPDALILRPLRHTSTSWDKLADEFRARHPSIAVLLLLATSLDDAANERASMLDATVVPMPVVTDKVEAAVDAALRQARARRPGEEEQRT